MTIQPQEPIVIEEEDKVFDTLWVADFSSTAAFINQEAIISLSLVPFSSTTGEEAPIEKRINLTKKHVLADVAEGQANITAEVGAALQTITAVEDPKVKMAVTFAMLMEVIQDIVNDQE